MSFIRLYNVKEYFPKYKIAGISEKLAGDVLVENGDVLTSLKSHHVEDPHLTNSLFLTRLPHLGGVDLRTCQELEYRPPASFPTVHGRVCVCLELTPQTRIGSSPALSPAQFCSRACHTQCYQISDHEKKQPGDPNLGAVASSKG